MGGRGSSSGLQTQAGGGGKFVAETSALDHLGNAIDLTDSPLNYGGLDNALTGDLRAKIEAREEKGKKWKHEHVLLLDSDGNVLEDAKGGKGSVGVSVYASRNSRVMTHNHPRENDGYLGGTFSPGDIEEFATSADIGERITSRASASEGVYSISKAAGFDPTGLKKYCRQIDSRLRSAYEKESAEIRKSYGEELKKLLDTRPFDYTAADYNARREQYNKALADAGKRNRANEAKAFNKYMVATHNALIDGQMKYGYTYTLERWTEHGNKK